MKQNTRQPYRFFFIAVTLLILWGAIAIIAFPHTRPSSPQAPEPFVGASPLPLLPPAHRLTRTSYPYSLIPGGVLTLEGFRESVLGDPVLRQFYAGFDFAHARLATFDRDQYLFVSFRQGSTITWTKRAVLVRKGEQYLTDGHTIVRTRCGNQASEIQQFPQETPLASLDTPIEDPVLEFPAGRTPIDLFPQIPRVDLTPLIAQSPEQPPIVRNVPLVVGGVIRGGPPPPTSIIDPVAPPVTSVPEPASWCLLSAGLLGIWALRRKLLTHI